jgi:hypothetical protein
MPKIPQCERCLFSSHDYHLVCAVHPAGPIGERCPDVRPDPNLEAKEHKNGFVLSCLPINYYNEVVMQSSQDSCPACGAEFERDYRAVIYLDCPCGWVDDSV